MSYTLWLNIKKPALSHQYGLAQAILCDVTLHISRQLHGQRTYFFPTGAFFIGYQEKDDNKKEVSWLEMIDPSGWFQQFYLFRVSNHVMFDSLWPHCICRTSPHAGAFCPPQIWHSDKLGSWWLERCCCLGCPAVSREVGAHLVPLRWGTVPNLKADRCTTDKSQKDAQHQNWHEFKCWQPTL